MDTSAAAERNASDHRDCHKGCEAVPAADGGDGERTPLAAWWLVMVLMVLYALSFLDRYILALLVDPIRHSLRISEFQVSLLQGASFAVFFALFGLPMGWAADRLPRRWVVFLGVIVWSVAASAGGFARHYWQLASTRFALGAGEAALLPAGYALVADAFPPMRFGLAMSVFSLGSIIGGGLATLGGAVVIAHVPATGVVLPVLGHFEAWQFVLLLCGLPCMLASPLIFTVRDRHRPATEEAPGGDTARTSMADGLRFIGRNKQFYLGHFLGFGLYSAVGYCATSWLPAFLMRHHHMGVMQVGSLLATGTIVGGVIGALFYGSLVDRLFARGMLDAHLKVSIAGVVAGVATMVIACTTESITVASVLAMMFFLIMGYSGVAAAAQQMMTPRAYRGRVTGIYLFVYTLVGAGMGPSVTAFITQYVLQNDQEVGLAIAIAELILGPLAILSLAVAAPAMRRGLSPID